MKLIVALMPEFEEYDARTKQAAGESDRLEPLLIQAYREWKNGKLYPDANGTQRFNYGAVAGYVPRDAVNYRCMTSLTGMMEKETGVFPFIVPKELKQAYAEKNFGRYADAVLGDMPVNFVTSNSGTNGNSGSPVINGKGRIDRTRFRHRLRRGLGGLHVQSETGPGYRGGQPVHPVPVG